MKESRWAAGLAVAVVLAVTIAAGPLVTAVDLTGQAHPVPAGHGTADVRLLDTPHRATLVRGAFGSGTYHLEAPAAHLTVGAVRGNPLVEYVVRIPAIGLADVHEYHLRRTPNRTVGLTNRPFEVSPTKVNRDAYNATVEIRLQSDAYRRLYRGHLDVEVVR